MIPLYSIVCVLLLWRNPKSLVLLLLLLLPLFRFDVNFEEKNNNSNSHTEKQKKIVSIRTWMWCVQGRTIKKQQTNCLPIAQSSIKHRKIKHKSLKIRKAKGTTLIVHSPGAQCCCYIPVMLFPITFHYIETVFSCKLPNSWSLWFWLCSFFFWFLVLFFVRINSERRWTKKTKPLVFRLNVTFFHGYESFVLFLCYSAFSSLC